VGRAIAEKGVLDKAIEFTHDTVVTKAGKSLTGSALGALKWAAIIGTASAAYVLSTPVTVPMAGAFGLWAALGYTTTAAPIASKHMLASFVFRRSFCSTTI
jgi:hypothetical protein